jgi:hypothetical protein
VHRRNRPGYTTAVRDHADRHREAAERHQEAAERHDAAERFWSERGDPARSDLERRNAVIERDAAQLERERAQLEEADPIKAGVRPGAERTDGVGSGPVDG